MSSSVSLSRTRSLRRAAPGSTAGDAGPRTTSPSRLPVKPPSTTTSSMTTRAAAAASSTAGSRVTRPRPISGNFSGRLVYGRDGTATQADTTTRSGVTITRRQTTTSQPTSTGPTRAAATSNSGTTSKTLARPSSSGASTSAASRARTTPPGTRISHSRTKSSATALTSATTFLPSQQAAAPRGAATNTITTSRPPPVQANKSQVHRRQQSQPVAGTTSRPNIARPTSRPSSRDGPRKQQKQQADQLSGSAPTTAGGPRLRPAFTTLQQHYSPAKKLGPKPLTSTYLAPPSPSKLPANVALSAETAHLQTELLQLHLLHRDADEVDAQWRASARQKLGERFAALALIASHLTAEEAEEAEQANARALLAWGSAGGRGGNGLDAKVQTLDAVLSGLWTLGEPGGKYSRVERRFEKWAERMSDVIETRAQLAGGEVLADGDDELLFVGELDASWKEDCAGLARRLDGLRRNLVELGPIPGEDDYLDAKDVKDHGERGQHSDNPGAQMSSLARVLRGFQALVCGMLAELALMESMEREAIAQEVEWLSRMIADDGGDEESAKAGAGAIWRVF